MEQILNVRIEQYKEEMYEKLAELIRIPSVLDTESACENAPYGKANREALDKTIEIGKELGFETRDYEGHAAVIGWGNEGREVGILSHVDVVPAGCGWNTDPFEPVIIDGKMFGRGTIDDKGPMIAALYAMKAVKESGLPVRNHVKHIVGCNEESGHKCVKYYLTKEKGPDLGFSPDANFAVIHGEKAILRFRVRKSFEETPNAGISILKIEGGTVANSVPNIAKVWIRNADGQVEEKIFHGVSVHAEHPWDGDNAIHTMLAYLKDLDLADENVKEYIGAVYELMGDGCYGENMGIACEDRLSGKLSMNLGTMRMDEHEAVIELDIRCPLHSSPEMIKRTLILACEGRGLSVDQSHSAEALYVPKDSELVQSLLNVYNEMTGSNEIPMVIGGGTYCRDVENFVSFGPLFPGEPDFAHQANEYIDLENMLLSAKIYAQALYKLMK